MGIIEVNHTTYQIEIIADIFLYGNSINEEVRQNIFEEMNFMWNEPRGLVWMNNMPYLVVFNFNVFLAPDIKSEEIRNNRNPKNNYFRIEEKLEGNISFVDALGSNTGLFQFDNLYKGSTTAAHEFGHTLGLRHPIDFDLRGKGIPGIMYPRGTLVDPQFQYDANAKAGEKGGTMYPIHRKVLQKDIDDLGLFDLIKNNQNVIGKLTNVVH